MSKHQQPFKGVAISAPDLRMIADALARAGSHLQPFEQCCAVCGEMGDPINHEADCPSPKVRNAYAFVCRKLAQLKEAGERRD